MTNFQSLQSARLKKIQVAIALIFTLGLLAFPILNALSSSSVIERFCEIVSGDEIGVPEATEDFHCSLAVFSTCKIKQR